MSPQSREKANIGVVEALFSGNGIGRTDLNADVSVSGPVSKGGDPHARFQVSVMRPGARDAELQMDVPLYKAERLRDSLDRILSKAEQQSE